ncbi:MAG: V-type ATPase subunit [Clostridiales bacterium]|jgi:V/A-type H+-transporting ATPase subunit C|nr:V-type ATPase subunit [Clostridiales bacterium]
MMAVLSDMIEYSALSAKLRALSARLLTEDDYRGLAAAKSVRDFAERLFDGNRFDDYTPELREAAAGGRVTLEKGLLQSLYPSLPGIFMFLRDENARKYLDAVILRYRADIIKGMIRAVFDRRPISDLTPRYSRFLRRRMGVDLDQLAAAQNIPEFLRRLGASEFADAVKNINAENPTLFDFETQIDFFCYRTKWDETRRRLSGANLASARRVNGEEIDMINISHIYRLKNHYELGESIIYSCIAPIQYKLKKSELNALVHAATDAEFADILERSHYRDVFTGRPLAEIERSVTAGRLRAHLEEERRHPFSLAIVTSYLYKKRLEVRNLVTLTECVRYGIGSEPAMRKILVPNGKGSDLSSG